MFKYRTYLFIQKPFTYYVSHPVCWLLNVQRRRNTAPDFRTPPVSKEKEKSPPNKQDESYLASLFKALWDFFKSQRNRAVFAEVLALEVKLRRMGTFQEKVKERKRSLPVEGMGVQGRIIKK